MTPHLPIKLDDLLHQRSVEGERVEYKAGWNPEAVLHSICAFANDFHNLGGGYVVVGVAEEDGRPVLPPQGIDPAAVDGILKELLNLGHHAVQPNYHPLAASYERDRRTVLVIWAPGGETRPYKARVTLGKRADTWAYYIRRHSSTVRARGADERELMGLAASVPFDDRYQQGAELADLDRRLIGEFLSEVGSELRAEADELPLVDLGRQMNIVGGPSEAPFPKNVGLLFFNQAPGRFFPATQIDVLWFPDGPGGDRFEEKEFRGPLGRITRDAIDFIQRNYLKETVVKHPDRPEAERFWNYPHPAIEEAIVNAVYHRSYEIREPIEVRITPEDLVVLSFPGPDRSIRLADLRRGRAVSRRYRNRRIGEFLKELDLTEGRSTGIPTILRAMADNGSPAPEFDTDEDRSFFLIRLPVHVDARPVDEDDDDQYPEVTPEVRPHHQGGQLRAQSGAQSGAQSDRVLAALAGGPLSIQAIAEALGQQSPSGALKRSVKELREAGLIAYTLPDKPQSRLQQYRLTEAGHARLAVGSGPDE